MDLANSAADTAGGFVINGGSPVFNGPVFIRSNYYCDPAMTANEKQDEEAVVVPPVSQDQEGLDLLVQNTSQIIYDNCSANIDTYRIRSNPKGRVLIINNEFKNKRNERKGSAKDLTKMVQLWDQMGCIVETRKNLTGREIEDAVWELVNNRSLARVDFCTVIVMSHGAQDDLIVGEKETRASVAEIVHIMKSSKVLRGKPKMLFFQMCRGKKAEKHQLDADSIPFETEGKTAENHRLAADSIPFEAGSREPESDSSWFRGMLNEFLTNHEKDHIPQATSTPRQVPSSTLQSDSIACDATAEEHIDGCSDMMIAFATQPDHVSFRGHDGSWFISAIAKIFADNAKDKDLKELMGMVQDEVRHEESFMPSRPYYDKCTATIEYDDTFEGRKFYLFPGFPYID